MAIKFYADKGVIYANYRKQKNGRTINLKYFPGFSDEKWDTKKQCFKDGELDKDFTKVKAKLYEVIEENDPFTLTNEKFTDLVNEKLLRKAQKQTPFFEYADTFIRNAKKEKGHEFANSFRTILNKLEEYDPKLTFERIDKPFYRNFKTWLEKQGYSKNYIGSMIRDLKRILNRATDDEINKNITFEKFSVDAEDVFNIYLSEAEIEKIYNLKISDEDIIALQKKEDKNAFVSKSNIDRQKLALDRARKLFIIGCWTVNFN